MLPGTPLWFLLFLWKIYSRFIAPCFNKGKKGDDGEGAGNDTEEKKEVIEPLQNGYADDSTKNGDPLGKVNFVPSNSVQTAETDIC